jgi:LacI family transcriptional regulator
MTQTTTDGGGKSPERFLKRATLADVAADLGLSTSTVSRALDPSRYSMVNSSTRERVVAAAERMGYRPDIQARSLMTGRTQTIVVIAANLGNPTITPVLHAVASRAAVEGIVPIIAETNEDSTLLLELINHMLSRRVDAIIVMGARRRDAEAIESAARLVPVVVAFRPLLDVSVPVIMVDDRKGGELVAAHFADLGHEVVAQLPGPSDVMNFQLRDEGFSSTARESGMELLPEIGRAEEPTFEEGQRLMRALLNSGGRMPTAVFAHNDPMAIGAMSVLNERGVRVPEDISIAGYNDMAFTAYLFRPLTTVRYPGWDMGHAAADAVVRLLAGEEEVESVCLEPVFVPRRSTTSPSPETTRH